MTEQQAEAYRLIESVFGGITVSAEDLSRAREAVATFTTAADLYELGQRRKTALWLSWRIDGSNDPALAAHDVSAAGAVAVANQLADTGIEVEVHGEDAIHRAAETMVNAAVAERFVLLTDMLNQFYEQSTLDELCTLVMMLVSMRGKAAGLAAS